MSRPVVFTRRYITPKGLPIFTSAVWVNGSMITGTEPLTPMKRTLVGGKEAARASSNSTLAFFDEVVGMPRVAQTMR
ncbi:hypothetical protein D3C87_2114260 [compost metagenome]